MSTVYATDHLIPSKRFTYWRDVICDAYLPIDCETPDTADFSGHIALDRLSKLDISRVTGSAQKVSRNKTQIARDSDAFFMLSLQLSDVGHLSQAGHDTVLRPGDFGLYTTSEAYQIECRSRVDQLIVQIPHEALLSRMPQAEMLTGLGVSASSEIGGLVSGQLRQCAYSVSAQSPLVQSHLQDMIIDLIAVGFASLLESSVSLARPDQLLLGRAKSVVRDNLCEDHLNPGYVADALGMSLRNLSRVFQRDGTTLTRFIRQSRLQAVAADLVDPRFVCHSISQIACKWGLHNFQHFSKVFKDHYGMPPRSYRAMKGQ